MNKGHKIVKTVFLVLVWVCLGLFIEITGPTLIDLKIRTQADYEQVAVAVSGRSVGSFIGCAIGGVLVDRFGAFCDLMIGVCLTGAAVATAFVPFSPIVELLWLIIVVQGTFEGVINVVGQKVILNLWKEKAASPLHILHGGFGVGSFIIPLIANPFLAIPKPSGSLNRFSNRTFWLYGDNIYNNNNNKSSSRISSSRNNRNISSNDINNTFAYLNISNNSIANTNNSIMNSSGKGTNPIDYIRESQIEIAYMIAAILTLALSSVFYTYHVRGRRKRKTDKTSSLNKRNTVGAVNQRSRCKKFIEGVRTIVNPATCTGGRFLYGVEIFGMLFLYFVNVVGGECILGKFIRAYSIEQLEFSFDEGSYINTAFWISFAVGRFSGFIAARYIQIRTLILIETGGVLVSTILLNIFATRYVTAFWILTCTMGLFHAPMLPSGIGWGDYHVEMTGMAITFLLLGGSIGGIVYLRLTGFLFETFGARSFLYHLLGYGIASFVLAVILDLIGTQHGNRFQEKMPENKPGDNQDDIAEMERMIENKTNLP